MGQIHISQIYLDSHVLTFTTVQIGVNLNCMEMGLHASNDALVFVNDNNHYHHLELH